MHVIVTGGTGFIGGHVVRQLMSSGHDVSVLVRPNSAHGIEALPGMTKIIDGDVLDEDLQDRLPDADAFIHLVGIIREAPRKGITYERLHVESTKNAINAATHRGIRRFVHMSALGASPEGPTEYFRSKGRAEALVRASGLDWTIFRPSVVFGPGDDFVNMLGGQVRVFPVVPVIGDGTYTLQPVAVDDVASGIVDALKQPESINQTFCVSGPETMSYDDLLDTIARGLGKKRARKAHVPLGLMRPTIRAMEGLSFFPITTDQLTMLLESNACDPTPFFKTFGIAPTRFEQGISEYLPQRS